MMQRSSWNRCAGVVLLEVIVAVAILGISLFSLLNALSQAVSSATAVRNMELSGRLLENVVNELQFTPLGELGEDEFEPAIEEGLLEGDFGEMYPGFRWERETAATDAPGLYSLRYTVLWESRGRERSETVWSYLFDAEEAAAAAVEGGEELPEDDTRGAPTEGGGR
jgi:hypothetical protein